MLKIFKPLVVIVCSGCFLVACDKDFEKVNTNPYAINEIDPALIFAGAQRTHIGTWNAEHTIVQQFLGAYNTGANTGFNFNADIDAVSTPKWGEYNSSIKNLVQALKILGPSTPRVNLKSMIRIWKAQIFMGMVDAYGDVPYFEAGKAVSDGLFYPKYDDDALIYDDLYKELKEATAELNAGNEYIGADLFYGTNAQASTKTTNVTDQVAKWKKLGNSLLLRLGMRYSRANAAKAQTIVAEAFAGGVMTSNADNAYVKNDGTTFTQGDNAALRNFSQFNYAAEPFVNQLKSTRDPRAKYMIANYADPGAIANNTNPDTVLANQFGVPPGITSDQILAGGPYRGARGSGLNYSQFNVNIVAGLGVPDFWVTYAQTSLLLAEAAKRGWVPGGDAAAQTYYENAIAADMATYALYPGAAAIPASLVTEYISGPGVAYNATDALKLINTQYWVVNIRNGTEAFANYRRSGFPVLAANPFVTTPIRRLSYPDVEGSANNANYTEAAAAIGGDKITSRVFWDTP